MASSSYSYVTGGAGNQKTLTLSGWFKVCKQVSGGCFFSYYYASTTARSEVFLGTTNELKVGICRDGSTWKELTYPNVMRDPGAWYNLVVAYDTTESVEADRVKTYINGNQITAASGTYPSLNEDTGWFASGYQQTIGRYESGDASYVDGCVTHVNFIEGTAYAPTAFGEFDATSGIWIAKSGPSVTYGDEGGFWKFASGALTTDSSGNSNTLTAAGTPTECKDSPDNNFCTLNHLVFSTSRVVGSYTNGNNTFVSIGGQYRPTCATVGLTAGLWYFEWKQTTKTSTQEELVGISGDQYTIDNSGNIELGYSSMEYGYNATGGHIRNSNAQVSYGVASAQNDIMGCYIDLTANKLYFAKNGTIMNSGTGYTITAASTTDSQMWVPAVCAWSGTQHTIEFNFGNGYFGTTAVTSGVADAGGEGTFEYDPSAGTFDSASKDFRAICTNNLGTYGG